MKADAKTESEVMNVIKQALDAFAKRDLDACLSFFAPDSDVVLIGTGEDEKCLGLAEIKAVFQRAFAQFKDASVKFGWHSVSAAGSLAWVAADVTLDVRTSGRELTEQLRLTSLLEHHGDRWLIIQWHDSLPAAGQKEGEAFST